MRKNSKNIPFRVFNQNHFIKKFINFSSEKSFKNIEIIIKIFLIKKMTSIIGERKKEYIQYLNALTRIQREETV